REPEEHGDRARDGGGNDSAVSRTAFERLRARDTEGFRPAPGERRRIEDVVAEHLFGGDAVAVGLGEVRGEFGRHLVGDGVRDAETTPLAAALIDEPAHASASMYVGRNSASTASLVATH